MQVMEVTDRDLPLYLSSVGLIRAYMARPLVFGDRDYMAWGLKIYPRSGSKM